MEKFPYLMFTSDLKVCMKLLYFYTGKVKKHVDKNSGEYGTVYREVNSYL